MLQSFGKKCSDYAEKFIPEPFVFAIFLTFLSFFASAVFTTTSSMQIVEFWYSGFWGLLAFAMQMSLILVTGHTLSTTRQIQWFIRSVASMPQNTQQAAFLVSFITILFGFLNWGLAIVIGAFLAKEVALNAAKRNIDLHYPLLGAAGYMGLAVWHGGLSGSAPLTVATQNHFLVEQIGIIPIHDTLFTFSNIFVCICLLIGIPSILYILSPSRPEDIVSVKKYLKIEEEQPEPIVLEDSTSHYLNHSKTIGMFTGVIGILYVVFFLWQNNGNLNINIINFAFLFLGIFLHKTPYHYSQAVKKGIHCCSGIILLFPFYAGIKGIMDGTGLAQQISQFFVSVANEETFALLTFCSSGIVNFFIPSGGGQWAVQGPVIVTSAQQLGVPVSKAIMAFSYGDQWTNLLQPFWALALLEITKLKARDIMGYCVAVMLIGFIFFSCVLLFL